MCIRDRVYRLASERRGARVDPAGYRTGHRVDGRRRHGEGPLELAAREGVTIYTIGIGADAMNVQDFFGQRVVNPSAQLDETTLTEIAKLTNGRFFRARDTVELAQIYRILDELEPTEQEQQAFQPRLSLYYWPLALALLIASMLLIGYRRGSL